MTLEYLFYINSTYSSDGRVNLASAVPGTGCRKENQMPIENNISDIGRLRTSIIFRFNWQMEFNFILIVIENIVENE